MTVEERVVAVVRDQLGVDESRITPDLRIMEEFDSPDTVALIMELEEEFDLNIPDEEAETIQTVALAVRYIEDRLARSKGLRSKGSSSIPPSGPLWDREIDG